MKLRALLAGMLLLCNFNTLAASDDVTLANVAAPTANKVDEAISNEVSLEKADKVLRSRSFG